MLDALVVTVAADDAEVRCDGIERLNWLCRMRHPCEVLRDQDKVALTESLRESRIKAVITSKLKSSLRALQNCPSSLRGVSPHVTS